MNDDQLEQHLRELPAPELPAAWRAEILAAAAHAARPPKREAWPPLLVLLRNLLARHPWTAGALTTLWILIFLLKAATPVDPSEKALLAHYDPHRPVYIVSLQDEIRIAELWQDPSDQNQTRQIP